MTTPRELLDSANARRFTCRREDAVRAIEVAIASLEPRGTSDQVGDLADAVDAFKHREFYVAVLLARGAMHSKPLEGSARPATESRTFNAIKQEFHALCGGPET